MRHLLLAAAATLLAGAAAAADTAPLDARIGAIARAWDHANYEVRGDAKIAALDSLAGQADALARQYPRRAEPLIWKGIVLSTEAGAKGGMGALSLVKAAKASLEQAEKIDPGAMGGSAYTSLGTLYYQAPGFTLGFGDKGKARAYLQKAVATNPNDVDANYFYGDFLYREGKYAEAERALARASAAPPRPGRDVGDRGRHAEAAALLAEVKAKHPG